MDDMYIRSQVHSLQWKAVVEVGPVECLLPCLLQELLKTTSNETCQRGVQGLFEEDFLISSRHLRKSGVLWAIGTVSIPSLRTIRSGSEDGLKGRVHSWLLTVQLSNEVINRLIEDVPASTDIQTEVAGWSLQEDSKSFNFQSLHQRLQGLLSCFLLICPLWKVLPLQNCLPTANPTHCVLNHHMHLVSQCDQLSIILCLSEDFDVGVLALTIGIDAIDVGIHQGVQGINCSQGMQVGTIDDGLSTSKVAVHQITSVAAQVVYGVDGLRQCQCHCDQCRQEKQQ